MQPLDPEIMKQWDKFIEYVNSLGIDFWPDYFSIYLWEEFKRNKRVTHETNTIPPFETATQPQNVTVSCKDNEDFTVRIRGS